MADASVRPALPADADAVARVQLTTWREAYAGLLPAEALAALEPEAVADRWRSAADAPPSPRHHLLVACADGEVVGYAATAPATDADCDPATEAELLTVTVLPAESGRGHGSRLMAAAVDHLRTDGFTAAVTWAFDVDPGTQSFLESAGWGLDGASRDLDMGRLVHQVRLRTVLTPG